MLFAKTKTVVVATLFLASVPALRAQSNPPASASAKPASQAAKPALQGAKLASPAAKPAPPAPAKSSQQATASKPIEKKHAAVAAAPKPQPQASHTPAVAKPKSEPVAKTAPSAPKPPVEKPADTNPAVAEAKVERRDPFESFLNRPKVTPNLPPGKAGLQVSTLRLDGIVHAPNGMIAVVSNPQSRTYFLREGDQLYDGKVNKIAMDGVSFEEQGKDAFGKPLEREVNKRIYSSGAGEQQ